MLAPVTRQYKDLSTPVKFSFVFYCDRCGREWKSDTYEFDTEGFLPPIDERILSMLWNRRHEEAYERANCEAGMRFSRCPCCGSRLCDDCLCISLQNAGDTCKGCQSG